MDDGSVGTVHLKSQEGDRKRSLETTDRFASVPSSFKRPEASLVPSTARRARAADADYRRGDAAAAAVDRSAAVQSSGLQRARRPEGERKEGVGKSPKVGNIAVSC